MKSVLIMGGTYFIGKSMVETLKEAGYEITLLNRGTKKLIDPKICNLVADRNDDLQMKEALESKAFDFVIDVSGLNQVHMHNLCQSLDLSKLKKFIFISSSAVYDLDHLKIPFRESDPICENTIWTSYGKNKIEAENYLEEFFSNRDVDFIALRPPYVYGQENYVPRESFIFEHLENNKPILVPNGGQTMIQFIHSQDLAGIVKSLIEKKTDKNMRFNVGNEKGISFYDWIKACEAVVGKEARMIPFNYKDYDRKVREFFPFNDYDNVLDTKKIRAFYPDEIDFIEGLKAAYAWYKDHKQDILFREEVSKNEEDILRLMDLN